LKPKVEAAGTPLLLFRTVAASGSLSREHALSHKFSVGWFAG
jgi:hypothetical protein